ncbi:MAG: right-handed parallel beta-helix repeat-containing protein [Thermoplasmata archaeon]|nr:MAG: right-handed parallel beta-helix repeat-containing protein [Thermoplasmata archaeon]
MKRIVNTMICTLFIMATFYFVLPLSISSANTIIVPDDYPTIQQAIDAANPGDTVYVRPGTYAENLFIAKTLILEGEDKDTTIIDGGGSDDVVKITARYVKITGFSIQHGGTNIGDAGIELNNAHNCLIINVNSSNNWAGIHLISSRDNVIENNVIYSNRQEGIDGQQACDGNTIENNIVHSNGKDGIQITESCDYNKIINNTIFDNRHVGISISESCNHNIIMNNIISDNVHDGIDIYLHSTYNTIIGNDISGSIVVFFLRWYSDNNLVYDNKISIGSNYGMMILYAHSNTIYNNTISENSNIGLGLSYSTNNVIYRNRIINNSIQAEDDNPSNNNWHHLGLLEGNYWSDYTGLDDGSGLGKHAIAGDGIGDTKIPHPMTNFDYYPFVDFYSPNQPPVAEAGPDQVVYEGHIVQFDGSGSNDPDGTIVTYDWDFGDGSPHGSGVNPTHTYNSTGNYTVTLTVVDNQNSSDTDSCLITVLPLLQPPVANAGSDQTVNEGDTVFFNGTGSYSPGWESNKWSAKADIPLPTWGGASTALNDEIYYMGGIPCYPIVNPTSIFMKYDPVTDSWFNLTDLPAPRAYLGAASANGKIYAIGGSEANISRATVFEYDPTSNSWTSKSPMPIPIQAFGIATVNDRIYVIGGSSISLINYTLKSVFEYDPVNDTWSVKPDMPTGRAHLACTILDDKIYAIGGYVSGPVKTVEIYDPVSETWIQGTNLSTARSGFGAEALGGNIYAFGGTGKWAIPTNSTEMYDPVLDSWTQKAFMLEPRVYLGSAVVGDCMYAMGGSYGPLIVAMPKCTEEYCVGSGLVYEWDFDASDGLWWDTGAVPDATGPTPTHVYGDDGVFVTTLRVTDSQNLTDMDICNITVLNVDPTLTIEYLPTDLEIGLRVAGRKYNDVGMILFENNATIGNVSIERLPGSPNEQMAWIPVTLNLTRSYSAIVTYTPKDPPNIGANPVWIYIKFPNGSIKKIHHNFNVQQSKKRDSNHWNHVEPWEVDLNECLMGWPFEVAVHITDPGSDDEILTCTYGSQNFSVSYLNDPPDPDPDPSPEVNPRDIMDIVTMVYEGVGTVVLIVEDDDGGIASEAFEFG